MTNFWEITIYNADGQLVYHEEDLTWSMANMIATAAISVQMQQASIVITYSYSK